MNSENGSLPSLSASPYILTVLSTLRCVSTHPFGGPVVPDV
jgi:hypothetical protein